MKTDRKISKNLKPCTPENAKDRQLKSARKRHENALARDMLYKLLQKRLFGKKTVSEADIAELGDDSEGYAVGKKAVRAVLDLDIMREKAKKTGNVRGYIELLKAAGVHFDQSREALGGPENPVNIAQTTRISATRVREISEELEDEC